MLDENLSHPHPIPRIPVPTVVCIEFVVQPTEVLNKTKINYTMQLLQKKKKLPAGMIKAQGFS